MFLTKYMYAIRRFMICTIIVYTIRSEHFKHGYIYIYPCVQASAPMNAPGQGASTRAGLHQELLGEACPHPPAPRKTLSRHRCQGLSGYRTYTRYTRSMCTHKLLLFVIILSTLTSIASICNPITTFDIIPFYLWYIILR